MSMCLKQSENKMDTQSFYQELLRVISTSLCPVYRYYDETYSYARMYGQMTRMNAILKDFKNRRVVLYSSKHFSAYSALYAILLSGNTWVPVDPELPESRCLSMIELAETDVILSDRRLPGSFDSVLKEKNIRVVYIEDLVKGTDTADFRVENIRPDDIAYIMFTSGSTGVPKGVPMTHRNYIPFIRNAMTVLPLEKNGVYSDYHDFGFDISIFYLFCCVLTESAFAPAIEKSERIFPLDNLVINQVTVWATVPSVITRFRRLRPDDDPETSLKIMFICGEPFPVEVLDYCESRLKIKDIYNFYGLTETGVENFYYPCIKGDAGRFRDQGFIPIGQPLEGNHVRIDSENSELMISGPQITPGYLGGREAERFETLEGVRWFRTGDIAKVDGCEYFLKGRVDSQVKLSGFRVELMDIESHIRKSGVREAVCFLHKKDQNTTLCCVVEGDSPVDSKTLSRMLKANLPDYMIPKKYMTVSELPRNRNGKIDRQAVENMYEKGGCQICSR